VLERPAANRYLAITTKEQRVPKEYLMMRIALQSALILLISLPALAQQPVPTATGRLVAEGAEWELLFTRSAPISGGLTEGPAVAPDGSIYFSDIAFGEDNGMIHRFDPASGMTTVFQEDSGKSNGLIFDSQGRLLACEGSGYGGRRLSRYNVANGERETVAEGYGGKRFNSLNDLCLDDQGRIYVTDPRYIGHEPRELEHRAVYRVDGDGSVIEVTHEVSKPNGIALSPSGRTLYLADHDNGTDNIDPDAEKPTPGDMKIYSFPLGSDGLVSGPRRTLVDFGSESGCDGMTVDSRGRIYLTARSLARPGVMVINPRGKEVAFLPTGPPNQHQAETPVGLPSNVEFGIGAEINVLYVTVDKSLYRIRLKASGYHRQYK
jgi:gluconolactonase